MNIRIVSEVPFGKLLRDGVDVGFSERWGRWGFLRDGVDVGFSERWGRCGVF